MKEGHYEVSSKGLSEQGLDAEARQKVAESLKLHYGVEVPNYVIDAEDGEYPHYDKYAELDIKIKEEAEKIQEELRKNPEPDHHNIRAEIDKLMAEQTDLAFDMRVGIYNEATKERLKKTRDEVFGIIDAVLDKELRIRKKKESTKE